MEIKGAKTYLAIIVFLILIYTSFLIVAPFISALLTSFILAYLFYPVFKKLNKLIKKNYISATLTMFIMFLIFIIPIILTTNLLIKEAVLISQNNNFPSELLAMATKYISAPEVSTYIDLSSSNVISSIQKIVTSLIFDIPSKLVEFLIIIFTTFYLLIYGESFINVIKKITPFKNKEVLFKHIGETTYAIVKGLVLVAIVEFIVAAIGLTILKVHSPLIWAILIGIAVFIPLFGPFIILLPLMILELINKNYYLVIGLLVLWAILSLIENLLRARLIGNSTKINPVIVLLGILGGIKLFGFIGIIAGPLILSMIGILIQDYYYEYIKE